MNKILNEGSGTSSVRENTPDKVVGKPALSDNLAANCLAISGVAPIYPGDCEQSPRGRIVYRFRGVAANRSRAAAVPPR